MAIDIRKDLRKMLPHLLRAQQDNLNEADTRQRIAKVFEDVLGYNLLEDITRESQIRDKYVDFAIKVDGAVRFLVEAKAAAERLRDRHIEQAERYAAEGNIKWVVLTNGVNWNLYHLTFDEGIEYERVFTIDLSTDNLDKAAEMLSLLHRRSIQKGEHEEFWQRRVALSAESIAKVIFTEDVLRLMRREIRRNEGILIDEEDLAVAIHEMFSTEARERVGPLRIKRKRKTKVKTRAEEAKNRPAGDTGETQSKPGTEEKLEDNS